jgi:hypothetical protein
MNPPLKVGLFAKTFKPDLDWLYFGLSSFKRNWSYESTDILVVAEPNCEPEMTKWDLSRVSTVYVKPWPDGYCHAMAMKMCADIFMPRADLILLFDSDMILTTPTSLADLMVNERPTLYYDDWHSDLDQATRLISKRVWSPAVFRTTGRTLEVDWMVSPLWLFWRSTFAGARYIIENHTRMPFLQAVYSTHVYDWKNFLSHPVSFCDMQTLGLFASEFETHQYDIQKRTLASAVPVRQFWSHQPIDEVKAQLNQPSSGSNPL